ncbi:MAG TPA: hypothetical protein ENI82_03240 [Bacteroidetes bacterium]|nr:hypothetical protein [Bacteroidota bacterium]
MFFLNCKFSNKEKIENPPAKGFHQSASDDKAIAIADEVMQAMGGRQNWDKTNILHWNFFGIRTLTWNKKTGELRIEVPKAKAIYLLNIFDQTGQVKIGDKAYSDSDSLAFYLQKAKNIWINDSYWLVMPFKLKDSGVTLKYIGEGMTEAQMPADILQLTFENVGETPQNKYHVFVNKKNHLVTQWSYFANASDEMPKFTTPWANYIKYGNILLSNDRGKRKLSDIAVFDKLPKAVFDSLESVDWNNILK